MKRLRKLLCVAVAMLWVLPVSAFEFDQRAQARLDVNVPEVESLEPLSIWIASDVSEFTLFEAADYEVRFEVLNATFGTTGGSLEVEALDAVSSEPLDSVTVQYTIDTTFVPFTIAITNSTQQDDANDFVHNMLPSGTRRVQLRPILEVDAAQDCDQPMTMRTWLRYEGAQVASDEPDHLVVPSVFICP